MGTPGKANYRVGKDGQKYLVIVAAPGAQPFIGRWSLKAGGGFTQSDKRTLHDGRQQTTYNYSFPANADVLVVNPDGTWFKQFAGKQVNGRWFDLGQNVFQMVGFEEEDWTGSVDDKGEMMIRGPVGNWEYGKRF